MLRQQPLKFFEKYGFEIIQPSRRINFKMPSKGWGGSAQYPTAWYTWQLNIGQPLTYAPIDTTAHHSTYRRFRVGRAQPIAKVPYQQAGFISGMCMTKSKQPYKNPPMTPYRALSIARYALLAAIDQDRAEGPTAALNDLLEANQVIDRLRKVYATSKEPQCQR